MLLSFFDHPTFISTRYVVYVGGKKVTTYQQKCPILLVAGKNVTTHSHPMVVRDIWLVPK